MELPRSHNVGVVTAQHIQRGPLGYDPSVTLFELERRTILASLDHFNGNKTRASKALGITIKTLYNKLHCFGVFEKYKHKARR